MKCGACGSGNPDDKRFCGDCGAALALVCPGCGASSPPDKKFCGDCGAALDSGATAPAAEAERRHLTVMFSDLAGSTAMSTELDPEDMRDVIRAYQDACADVVARFGGYLAKYMGDGVLVYFGYPEAHEDDAERAINTGLGIVDAVGALDGDLAVRVGIATGTVVVGDIVGQRSAQEAAITGETPNLAARLQGIAAPDSVVIAETTRALAGGMFELVDLGEHDLKGFADPVRPWAVSGRRRIESRFEATRAEDLSELIGRDEEIEILMRRWRRARDGEGQVVLISGEPGIGKSRLAREFQDRIADEPRFRLRHQCSPYHTGSALHPVIERLERAAGFEAEDEPVDRLAKLEALIEPSGVSVAEVAPLFATLLSIPTGERYPPLNVSPQRKKELTLRALLDQLGRLAAHRPVLFVIEDAHWIDPTTLELMELTVEFATEAAVLVLITHRPEFEAPWIGRPRVTPMILGRLERGDCARIVDRLAGDAGLPDGLMARITDQTDGVPLFVEELTKSVMETASGAGGKPAVIDVPATLHDSLAARLDRLGPAKEVAQIGAVIGREFSHELLETVSAMEPDRLGAALDRLVGSGLVTRRGDGAAATYAFKHALVQGTARGSLLRDRRAELHRRVAERLEDSASEVGDAAPEILAYHYTEAGASAPAVDHWHEAGRRAMLRSANVEAEEHIRKGLAILAETPESPEHRRREIGLLNTLGVCLAPTRGYGSAEVADAYSRVASISEQEGDKRGLFVALRGKGQYQMVSGDLSMARDQSGVLLDLANELDDQGLLIEAHHLGWSALSFTGDYEAARRHAETAIELYDRERHHQLTYVYSGHDPGVCCRSFGSLALWQLGFPDRALAGCLDGKALAEELSHPFSTIVSWWGMGLLRILRREVGAVLEAGETLIHDCTEMGFRTFLPIGRILRGGALAEQGGAEGAIEEIWDAIAEMRGEREYTLSVFYAWLAELCLEAGRLDEAKRTIDDGRAMSEANAERFCLPEFHRIEGELLLARGVAEEAEESMTRALASAHELGSRSFALRAATSLARLYHARGRSAAARDLLAPIHGQFTEGFETADWMAAKALLEEIGGSV